MPKGTRIQPVRVSCSVEDAVSASFSTIEELAAELREWYDNMPPNLQGGDKGSAVGEAADDMEGITEPDVPDCAKSMIVTYLQKPLKERASRSSRLSHGLEGATQAIAAVETELNSNESDLTEGEIEELEAFRDDLQAMIDDAENVEFPGMVG